MGPWSRGERPRSSGGPSRAPPAAPAAALEASPGGSRAPQPGEAGRGGLIHGHAGALGGWQLSGCFFTKLMQLISLLRKAGCTLLAASTKAGAWSPVHSALWSQGPGPWPGSTLGRTWEEGSADSVGGLGSRRLRRGQGCPQGPSVLPLGLSPRVLRGREPEGGADRGGARGPRGIRGRLCPDARGVCRVQDVRSEGASHPRAAPSPALGRAVLTWRVVGSVWEDTGSSRQG